MPTGNKMKIAVIGSVITFGFYIPGAFTNVMLDQYTSQDSLNFEFNSWMIMLIVMGYSGMIGGIATRLLCCRAIVRKQKRTTYWQRYAILSLFLPALFVGGTMQWFNIEVGFRWNTLMLGVGVCLKAVVTNFVLAAIKFKPQVTDIMLDEDLIEDDVI